MESHLVILSNTRTKSKKNFRARSFFLELLKPRANLNAWRPLLSSRRRPPEPGSYPPMLSLRKWLIPLLPFELPNLKSPVRSRLRSYDSTRTIGDAPLVPASTLFLESRENEAFALWRRLWTVEDEMVRQPNAELAADMEKKSNPPFGSYIGLFFAIAMLGILGFSFFYETGGGHVLNRVKPGMNPTEVAAILGVPRSENRVRDRLVQDWHFADGSSVEIVFQDGKLVSKSQRQAGQALH